MDIILPLLVLIIGIISSVSKNAKRQQKKKGGARPPQRPTGKGAPRWEYARGEGGAFSWQTIHQALEQYAEPPAAAPEPVVVRMELSEGDSYTDSYDVGGSLRRDSHEGLEFEGHVHTSRPDEAHRPPEHGALQPQAQMAPGLSAGDMRRAIVMAELLERPLSLRRRYPR